MTIAEYFGTPIPGQVFEDLRQQRSANEGLWYKAALAGAGYDVETAQRLVSELAFPSRIGLVCTMVFPPSSYLHAYYAIPTRNPVWQWYLRYWEYQVAKVWKAWRF